MNLRRMGMLLAVIALVLLVVFVGYQWLNAAVSLDYARQEQTHQRERAELLRSLLQQVVESRWSRADLAQVLTAKFGKEHIIKEEGDTIAVDDIVFKFREGHVIGIGFLGEEVSLSR